MEHEDYLSRIYTPLKSIELLSDIIYTKYNEDWCMFSEHYRKDSEELLALNYMINICAKHLLKQRQIEVDNL